MRTLTDGERESHCLVQWAFEVYMDIEPVSIRGVKAGCSGIRMSLEDQDG